MKKIITILMVIGLCVGCGAEKDETDVSQNTNESTNTEEVSQETDELTLKEAFVDPDFKAALDGYEIIIDDYINFMNDYDETNPEMIDAYFEYLKKYVDVMDKIEQIDADNLSEADALYYIDFTARIYKKLEDFE